MIWLLVPILLFLVWAAWRVLPVWWAVRTGWDESKRFHRVFFVEDTTPYRRGNGYGIRVGHRTFMLGWFWTPSVASQEEALGGKALNLSARDIQEWTSRDKNDTLEEQEPKGISNPG